MGKLLCSDHTQDFMFYNVKGCVCVVILKNMVIFGHTDVKNGKIVFYWIHIVDVLMNGNLQASMS